VSRRLQEARRELERLEWEHARALRKGAALTSEDLEPRIRDARWHVTDLETAERTATVRAARRTAALLDVVLGLVAVLVMAFSLGNIHTFACGHGVADPLGWLLAPMVDLALIGTLGADAFLSRHGMGAGRWAAALRWFAGLTTLTLNTWDALTTGAPGDVLAHTVPPLLLVLLAEAAPHYRRGAHAAIDRVRASLNEQHHTTEHPPTAPPAPPTADSGATAGQAATAPAHKPNVSRDSGASGKQPRTRARQVPSAGKTQRSVRTDAELLEALRELRTGADAPLSQRAVLAALGIGVPRLRALLDAHGLTLDPLPAPAPLHLVDTDHEQQGAAAR
jgi:hypothetical protein